MTNQTPTINPRLQQWHRHAEKPARTPLPRTGDAYVPELSERLERDPNLTDGARRCARLIAAYVYRRDRDTRRARLTVTYLTKALGKCRRSVQRYLRQLEAGGYIVVAVVLGHRSRLCTGLAVQLLRPLFPKHHKARWPQKAMKSGATKFAQNYRPLGSRGGLMTVKAWDRRCREGLFNALCRALPPLTVA